MSDGFDAEIFVSLPKEEAPAADLLATHFEKKIAKWRDPHAQPLVRTRCSSWAVPWPGAKVCVGWKVESQPLYVDLVLQIDLEEPEDIDPAIAETLKEGRLFRPFLQWSALPWLPVWTAPNLPATHLSRCSGTPWPNGSARNS